MIFPVSSGTYIVLPPNTVSKLFIAGEATAKALLISRPVGG